MKDTLIRCIKKGAYFTIGLFFVISCNTRKSTTPSLKQYYTSNLDSLVYQLQLLEKSNDLTSLQTEYLKSRKYFKKDGTSSKACLINAIALHPSPCSLNFAQGFASCSLLRCCIFQKVACSFVHTLWWWLAC